jgi:hypothetical protein
LKRTIIVYSSNREPPRAFTRSIERVMLAGVAVVPQEGTVDVALARNLALTAVVHALRGGTPADVVLMVDDDMAFEPEDVGAVAKHVRETGRPASAAYVMADGRLAARKVEQRWHTGLGFLALPASQLLELALSSPLFVGTPDGALVHEFTRAGVVERDGKRVWSPEDFHFCERLGGVDLLSRRVAHMKVVPLRPNERLLANLLAQHEERPTAGEVTAFAASMRAAAGERA